MTPIAQISIDGPILDILPVRTSGAMYISEPASILSTEKVDIPEIPKSTILIYLFLYYYLFLIKRFQHHILKFQISVNQFLVMTVINSVCDLLDKDFDLFLFQTFFY